MIKARKPSLTRRAGFKGKVEDIAVRAGFMSNAGAGIDPALMKRHEAKARLKLGEGLSAVAMVDIEVNDRSGVQSSRFDRMHGGDCNSVEQAEAHGSVGFGMVSRRARSHEDRFRLAIQHRIHRSNARARSGQRGVKAAGAHLRVSVQGGMARCRRAGEDMINVSRLVHAFQVALVSRLGPVANLHTGGPRTRKNGPVAFYALRVTGGRQMAFASGR